MKGYRSEIKELIGEKAYILLINKYRGSPLYVPKQPDKIADTLGSEAAKLLTSYYGGEIIKVPLGKKMRMEARDSLIFEAYESGATAFELSLKYDLDVRTIRRIVAKQREKVRKAGKRKEVKRDKKQKQPEKIDLNHPEGCNCIFCSFYKDRK